MFNTIEELEVLTKRTTKVIEVAGVGTFMIKALSSSESIAAMKDKDNLHAKTVFYGLINEDGKQIFTTKAHLEKIKQWSATIVVQMANEIMKMHELSDIKEIEGK